MLKGAYAEKVLKGIKKATIRRGIVKPKYEEVIVHAGGKPIAKIKITRMYFKKVKDLGDYEAKLEGYSTKDELINELKKVYKDIHDDEYMTIIEFEVIQRLDHLEPVDQYYGLSPGDIARIALRYISDELSDLDRKILLDLTKTNSIRQTCINVFKDLNKRKYVRKVLRNALRILIDKNIIKCERAGKNGLLET
ncbi:MAG: ASCH domain-containing protein [Desulfurococcaceae archaeon]